MSGAPTLWGAALPSHGRRRGARDRKTPEPRALVPPLLAWFTANARALPWRRTLDPYAIWVSEIMLQQTQVKTVLAYWDRWMNELPTIRALAAAAPEKVLKLWEGLGYYTRVRQLQSAARQLVQQHHGCFPAQFDQILALPGIGRYTAGAIASIAFNQPRPILDGNVIRVLTRLFGIGDRPRERQTAERLWSLASDLVRAAGPSEKEPSPPHAGTETRGEIPAPTSARECSLRFAGACSRLNQSLMELGATVCTPRQPGCQRCPVRRFCVAYSTDRVAVIPNLGKRPAPTARRFIAFVLEHRGKWLVRRRPAGSVNAALWEFPNIEVTDAGHAPSALTELAAQVTGGKVRNLQPLLSLRHSITRYRIQLEAFRGAGRPSATEPPGSLSQWLPLSELEKLPFTSAHRKVLKTILPAGDLVDSKPPF